MKLKNLFQYAKKSLGQNQFINRADLEAYLIIAHALGIESRESFLFAHERILTENETNLCMSLIEKRIDDCPMHYILGNKEFWDYKFMVNSDVLIPRPETELIIEIVLRLYPQRARAIDILDLGTGSGCIAITLLKLYLNATALAVDISEKALVIATKNAVCLDVSCRTHFLQSDWFSQIENQQFDLIVSNPPYISKQEWLRLSPHVQCYEPSQALTDSSDGLSHYSKIFSQLRRYLKPNGIAIFEFGYNQSSAITKLASQYKLVTISIEKDLAGISRCIILK